MDSESLAGKDNTIAEALSRLEVHAIADLTIFDSEAMVAAQKNEVELHSYGDVELHGMRLSYTALPL